MNKTKLIATIGPGCDNIKTLQALVDHGVSCFRVNLSHGTMDEKEKYFTLIRSLNSHSSSRPAILADLAGPKIRVRRLQKEINLKIGDPIVISSNKKGSNILQVSKGVEFEKVNPGAKILIDDGRVTLEVKKRLSSNTLDCVSLSDGKIEDRKGVNFPGIQLNVPVLTKQDELDLMLSLSNKADWIAVSFVRSASDYYFIKEKITSAGYTTPVMAKIEKWEAVKDLKAIIASFDAVMVARGDLGVEMPIEKVPLIQKKVVETAARFGKPAVIATQILDSMIDRPIPTRAEVSDIANAILDGTDALMVTGETAVGKHPREVIEVLSRVIEETESSISYKKYKNKAIKIDTANAISHAACTITRRQNINILVTMTHSGSTARKCARYRPLAKIIAMTPFKRTCRRLSIVWGVIPIVVDNYNSSDEIPELAKKELRTNRWIKKSEDFVITGGVPVGISGTTNYLTVLKGF